MFCIAGKNVLNLLSVPTPQETDRRHLMNHIVPIININAFLSHREERKNGKTKQKYIQRKAFVCLECFQIFRTKYDLQQHREICQNPRGQKIQMPDEGEVMEFRNFFKKFHTPVRGYFGKNSYLLKSSIC